MAKIGDRRVAVCEHTGKEVVQEYEGKEWLCLHNNNPVQNDDKDAREVKEYKKREGK